MLLMAFPSVAGKYFKVERHLQPRVPTLYSRILNRVSGRRARLLRRVTTGPVEDRAAS